MRLVEQETETALELYVQRLGNALGLERLSLRNSPLYLSLFGDRSVHRFLRLPLAGRVEPLELLLGRIKRAGQRASQVLEGLPAAIEAEKEAVARLERLREEAIDARDSEKRARRRLVGRVRIMTCEVQGLFAERPAEARRVLGYASPRPKAPGALQGER